MVAASTKSGLHYFAGACFSRHTALEQRADGHKVPSMAARFACVICLLASLPLVCLASGEVEKSIPLAEMERWQHFSRMDLGKLAAANSGLDFSQRHTYEGEHALHWKYAPGASLLWPLDCPGLGRTPMFYLTALDPRDPGASPCVLRLEFLDDKGNAAGSCEMPLVRRQWNRCILRISPNHGFLVGVRNVRGSVPKAVSAVRITPAGSSAGEVFFGTLLLSDRMMLRRDDAAELDGFPESVAPDISRCLDPDPSELAALTAIGERLEKNLMDTWFSGIGKPFDVILAEVCSHYMALELRRTEEGMKGRNLIMEHLRGADWGTSRSLQVPEYAGRMVLPNTLHPYGDFSNGPHAYCTLMLDVANCYRRESDPGKKAELLDMYRMMFDYSQYLGGFPGPWFGGEGYVESIFLMRGELLASGRIAPPMLDLMRRQVDFDRIFLRHSSRNAAVPGTLGEDCDYTRLTSERLILLSLMEGNPKLRNHFLHAFSRWFSGVVLACAPGVAGTFKPDGSTNHHSGLQFGYGNGALITCARVTQLFAGTPYRIDARGHAFLKDMLMKRRCFSRNGLDPLTLSGKETLVYANSLPAAPYLLMALAGSPDGKESIDGAMAAVYLRLVSESAGANHPMHEAGVRAFERAGIKPEPVPQGHWTLGWSAAAVHRHHDWLLSLRGYSRYAYSRECGHPGGGIHITPYIGFGTMELLAPDDYKPRNDYFWHETGIGAAGFDWTKFPGTTAVFLPAEKRAWQGD